MYRALGLFLLALTNNISESGHEVWQPISPWPSLFKRIQLFVTQALPLVLLGRPRSFLLTPFLSAAPAPLFSETHIRTGNTAAHKAAVSESLLLHTFHETLFVSFHLHIVTRSCLVHLLSKGHLWCIYWYFLLKQPCSSALVSLIMQTSTLCNC